MRDRLLAPREQHLAESAAHRGEDYVVDRPSKPLPDRSNVGQRRTDQAIPAVLPDWAAQRRGIGRPQGSGQRGEPADGLDAASCQLDGAVQRSGESAELCAFANSG